jgi:hypothetical protein
MTYPHCRRGALKDQPTGARNPTVFLR